MSSTAVAVQDASEVSEIMHQVIAAGDLKNLPVEVRTRYIEHVCHSMGLNPLTKQFDLIMLNGKLTMYATKGVTDQLRKINKVDVRIVDKQRIDDVYVVTVEATTADGRTDTDIGALNVAGLKGDALANALMKAITKAKRRVTLSICGLGMLDESELSTIPSARPVVVDQETGEIQDAPETRQNAPQRTEPTAKGPTPIAEGNKATKDKIVRITSLFDDLGYEKDQRRPTLAQLVGQPDPLKLTKAQADKVIAALETEFDQRFEYVGHDGVEWRERNPNPDSDDAIDVAWEEVTEKPAMYTDEQWAELMNPGEAKGGDQWTRS